jgi:release factor glutamine methyltransferase
MANEMTVTGWLTTARAALSPLIGPEEAARDVRLMLGRAAGWSAAQVSVAGPTALSDALLETLQAMLARRMRREPLAQILGDWAFYGRRFRVTRDTLTPRPDTETLIDLALAAPFSRVLDLGTGTGAIVVSLLAERAGATGVANDISPAALAVAAENAQRHAVAERLELVHADWWTGVAGQYDLIVSNPPYVTEADYDRLAPEITRWEPRTALTPGGDGLSAYRIIAGGLAAHLVPGGRCLVEIGADQGVAVADLLKAAGLEAVAVYPDINGKARVVGGVMPTG